MKKNMKKGLCLFLASVMLAGCGRSEKSNETAGGDAQAVSQSGNETTPVEGDNDTFYLALVAEKKDKFDHLWNRRGDLEKVVTFRSLFLADATLDKVKPDLAESYTISDDGLVYTIDMKEGLKWSDGEGLTADDVKFSLETVLKASQVNGIYTTAFSKINGAKEWKEGDASELSGVKVDGNTITITLDEAYGSFDAVLAQFAIYPKHRLEHADPLEIHNNEFWENPVTSGMYHVTEFNSGNYYVLEPNPNYEGTAPKIPKIQLNFVADYITTAQAGQIDYYSTNATDQLNEISKLTSYTQYPVDMMFYRYFVCNIKDQNGNVNPVIGDKKVREALLYAIDRKTLGESLFPGLAELNNTGVPINWPDYDTRSNSYDYNPEKAKELLKEANFDFNKTLRIRYYYSDQTTIDFLEAVSYYLSEVGIKTDVQKFQADATTELYKTKEYEIAYKGLSAFNISEWYSEYASTNANFVNVLGGDKVFDDLNKQFLAETDASERSKLLKQLQVIEQENLFKLPLYTIKNIIFVNTDRVKLPDSVEFTNPWYMYDLDFANWELK